jgi:hypothetical protein
MVKERFLPFLGAAAIAMGFGIASPRAEEIDCSGSPSEAVRTLPAPLHKWGHISCTEFGHMLGSRQGWVWAWLDGSGSVAIPSQMVRRNPAALGNASYFVMVEVIDLEPEELLFVLSIFGQGLDLHQGQVKGYRVNFKSVSGRSLMVYFLDFDTFAGGVWCPDSGCVPEWRFMIMEKDRKALSRAAAI